MNTAIPSFYAIIPANVRYCKDLEPNAKLLYGEITALCQKEGYCWASNAYFAELYDVDERTIRRWIESLEKNNLIFKDFESGFNGKRRLWLSREIQESFTKGQKCPKGGTKMSGGEDKNVLHINTYNNTSNNCVVCVDQPPVGASPLLDDGKKIEKKKPDGSTFQVCKNDIFMMAVQKKKDWTPEEIDELWEIVKNYSSPIRDTLLFCEGTINNQRKIKGIKEFKEKKECNSLEKNTEESKNQQKDGKKKTSEKGSLGLPFQNWRSMNILPPEYRII